MSLSSCRQYVWPQRPAVEPGELIVGVYRANLTCPPEAGPKAELVSGSIEAGECNAHYAILGDSNSKAQVLSIDTGIGSLAMESMKSGEVRFHQ